MLIVKNSIIIHLIKNLLIVLISSTLLLGGSVNGTQMIHTGFSHSPKENTLTTSFKYNPIDDKSMLNDLSLNQYEEPKKKSKEKTGFEIYLEGKSYYQILCLKAVAIFHQAIKKGLGKTINYVEKNFFYHFTLLVVLLSIFVLYVKYNNIKRIIEMEYFDLFTKVLLLAVTIDLGNSVYIFYGYATYSLEYDSFMCIFRVLCFIPNIIYFLTEVDPKEKPKDNK